MIQLVTLSDPTVGLRVPIYKTLTRSERIGPSASFGNVIQLDKFLDELYLDGLSEGE